MRVSEDNKASDVRDPVGSPAKITEEDRIRANTYRLLGTLMARPPNQDVIDLLRLIEVDTTEHDGAMAAAWKTLSLAADRATVEALDDEYHTLFIGIGRGEIVPYSSWYLTGFMMERPLAQLRTDLKRFGLERAEKTKEPEDHAGALCETMSLLIESPKEISPHVQKAFFDDHIAPWMGKFFEDLQQSETANFYSAVGALGEQFIEVDRQYLEMLPH